MRRITTTVLDHILFKLNKDGTYNISGKLSQSDKAIIDDHTGLFPTGLTLTLTEVFKKIES